MKYILSIFAFSFASEILFAQIVEMKIEYPATIKNEAGSIVLSTDKEGIISKIEDSNSTKQIQLIDFKIIKDANTIRISKKIEMIEREYYFMINGSSFSYYEKYKKGDHTIQDYRYSHITVFDSGPIIYLDDFQEKLHNIKIIFKLKKEKEYIVLESDYNNFSRAYSNDILIDSFKKSPQNKFTFRKERNIVYIEQFQWMEDWNPTFSKPLKITGKSIFSKKRMTNVINYYILECYGAYLPMVYFPLLFSEIE